MSITKITIAVAINECGEIKSIPFIDYHIQRREEFNKWKKGIKDDPKHVWQISYLTAYVPVPNEPLIEATVIE